MPISFTTLREQLQSASTKIARSQKERVHRVSQLRAFFEPTFEIERWQAACQFATREKWSCAKPTDEIGNALYDIDASREPTRYALISSDGSQIMPDRHKPYLFSVVHVKCVCVLYGVAPDESAILTAQDQATQSLLQINAEDDLRDANGELIASGEISLQRDLAEIEQLAEACERLTHAGVNCIALVDGSIMPFTLLNEHVPERKAVSIAERVVRALNRIRACGALIAGFIDRPNSNALTRGVALALRNSDKTAAETFISIGDREWLQGTLPKMKRTALFDPDWQSLGARYIAEHGHALHFCYVNLSDNPNENIARVEIPTWCVHRLDEILAALARQSSIGSGYPFCLIAAHQEAVISRDIQKQIEKSLEGELLDRGLTSHSSSKQQAKDRL